MALIKMALAGAAGYAFYKYATREAENRNAAFAAGEGSSNNASQVRNAGPSAMRDKPKKWSKTDEAIDESFPASDPTANY